jgi:YbbR domain-containing protein
MMNITDYRTVVRDVPVNVALRADDLARLDLNIIEISHSYVSIEVEGERGVVGNLQPEDLVTTLQIPANLVEPDVYDLRLELVNPAERYRVVSFSPRQVRVRLDQLERRTFEIMPDISGVSLAPGHIIEQYTVSPRNITVTGPRAEIERIAGATATVRLELDQVLERTYATELPIVMLDAQGMEMNLAARHFTLSTEQAQLVIPVLRERELPLEIRFLAAGVPERFPLNDLQYTMSNYEVLVAGPVDAIMRHHELLLGFIDLRTITPDSHVFTFDVEMPAPAFINLDNIFTVTVNFHMGGMDEAMFTVGEVELLNIPPRYDVTLLTSTIPNVRMIGEQDIIEQMIADDIVAWVDLSERALTPGQYRVPVRISAPGKGLVWAAGEYGVVVQVSERE